MINRILHIVFVFIVANTTLSAQNDSDFTVYGRILAGSNKDPVSNAHVINKRTFAGTVSNSNGFFYMEMKLGDTVLISSLGYEYYYYHPTEKPTDLISITLEERVYMLSEVDLNSYKLTSNEPKEMKLGTPMVPETSDINYPEHKKATLANPVDFLYEMFSNRSKQLKKLRELQAQDQYKHKLEEGNNRETLTNLTGLSKEELEEFLFFCKYSESQIFTMNDYTLLVSLLACYDKYLRIKEREDILKEYEEQETSPTTERFK